MRQHREATAGGSANAKSHREDAAGQGRRSGRDTAGRGAAAELLTGRGAAAEICAEEVAARREMLHEGRCGSIGKQLRAEVPMRRAIGKTLLAAPLRRVIGKKKHLFFHMNKI